VTPASDKSNLKEGSRGSPGGWAKKKKGDGNVGKGGEIEKRSARRRGKESTTPKETTPEGEQRRKAKKKPEKTGMKEAGRRGRGKPGSDQPTESPSKKIKKDYRSVVEWAKSVLRCPGLQPCSTGKGEGPHKNLHKFGKV